MVIATNQSLQGSEFIHWKITIWERKEAERWILQTEEGFERRIGAQRESEETDHNAKTESGKLHFLSGSQLIA